MKIFAVSFLFLYMFLIQEPAKAQWRRAWKGSNPTNDVTGSSFYTPRDGFISTMNYMAYATDSGKTITQLTNAGLTDNLGLPMPWHPIFQWNGVQAFSRDTLIGYGLHDLDCFIATSFNGGLSWTTRYYYDHPFQSTIFITGITDMDFPSRQTGYAVQFDKVLKTTNGGQSWFQVLYRNSDGLAAVDFPTVNTGYTYSSTGLFKTSNGGLNWQQVIVQGSSGQFVAMSFVTENTGFINDSDGKIFKTTDGGFSWTAMNSELQEIAGNRMKFINENEGYISLPGYSVFKTNDGGRTWEPTRLLESFTPGFNLEFGHLFFYNNQYAWASGTEEFLAKTDNGGGTSLPRAVFEITGVSEGPSLDTVKMRNHSRTIYSYQWFRNGQLFSTSYDASYTRARVSSIDTIRLVVSNGTETDTAEQVRNFYFTPPVPPTPYYGLKELNFPFADTLSGAKAWGQYGVVSGKRGIYVSSNINDSVPEWTRMTVKRSSADSTIYSHTRFLGVDGYRSSGSFIVKHGFAWGRDTVANRSVILLFNLQDSMQNRIIYNQPTQVNFAVQAYNSGRLLVAGNNGLFIDVDTFGTVIPFATQTTRDLYAVYESTSFENPGRRLYVAGDSISILFRVGVGYESSLFIPDRIRSASRNQVFAGAVLVGKKLYDLSPTNTSAPENDRYDFGPMNGSKAYNHVGLYIGSDHGIYKAFSNGYGYEFMPASQSMPVTDMGISQDIANLMLVSTANGKLYRSRDAGGPVKPFALVYPSGGCLNQGIYINHTAGTGSTCKWFKDGVLLGESSCGVVFPLSFSTPGSHEVKLITSNTWGFSDTATAIMHVSSIPKVDISYLVADTVLCKKERLNIRLSATEPGHTYEVWKKGAAAKSGFVSGQGGTIYLVSDSISESGYFYLKSRNTLSGCTASFTDSFYIRVEKTRAEMYSSYWNAYIGEPLQFFSRSVDAQNFNWSFPADASLATGNQQVMSNISFGIPGPKPIQLIVSSNAGCSDTLVKDLLTIVPAPLGQDTCYAFNFEDSLNQVNPANSYGIAAVTKAGNEMLVGGAAHKPKLESRYGSPGGRQTGSGLFLARYSYNGMLRWAIYSRNSAAATDQVADVKTDAQGNIYVTGSAYSRNYTRFANGDSLQIALTVDEQTWTPRYDGFIMKLDSMGRLIWRAVLYGSGNPRFHFDQQGNLLLNGGFSGEMRYYFNGANRQDIFTLSNITNPPFASRNYLIKLSPEGNFIWKTYAEHSARTTAGSGIDQVKADAMGNTYHYGRVGVNSKFYNRDNSLALTYSFNPANQNAHQVYLVKYDTAGNLAWNNLGTVYRGSSRVTTDDLYLHDLVADSAGNCYVNLSSWPFDSTQSFMEWKNADGTISTFASKYMLLKISAQGIFRWNAGARGSTLQDFDFANSPLLLKEDKLYAAIRSSENTTISFKLFSTTGQEFPVTLTSPDFSFVKFDTSGAILQVSISGQNFGGFVTPTLLLPAPGETVQLFGAIDAWGNGGSGLHSIYGNNVGSLSSDAFTVNISRGGCGNAIYNNSTVTDTSAPRIQIYYYDTLLNRNLRMRAIVSDYNAVDSAPGFKPMIHFRKHFNGDWLSATGSFVSGDLKNAVWEFEIPIGLMYPVYMNDTIPFVLVAKEAGTAGRIGSFPAAGNNFSSINNTSGIINTLKYIRKDKFAPVITHTAIPNPQIATPVKLQAQIVDSTGMFNTGENAPRAIAIFTNGVIVPNTTQYRDTAYGILQSGTNKDGIWEFSFRPQVTGILPLNTPFRYFFAALDSTMRIVTLPNNPNYQTYQGAIYGDGPWYINKVITDSIGPVSALNPLPPTNPISNSRISLGGVELSDTTAIDTSISFRPRIYFRIGSGSWRSAPGSLTQYHSAYRSTWSFTMDFAAAGLNPQSGDLVYYYIIAQDRNPQPNPRSNPAGAVAVSTTSVSSPPANPYSFVISSVTGLGNLPTLTDASIRFLPNPSDGNFVMLITGNVKKGTVRIWDAAGRELYHQQFERIVTPVTIPMPMNGLLGKGTYLVMLITDKGVVQEKLLVQ